MWRDGIKNPTPRAWTALLLLLIVALALGALLLILRFPSNPPLELVLPTASPLPLPQVYVGGEVVSPGFYPWRSGDSLEEVIQAAGGLTRQADPSGVKILLPPQGESHQPQRVNINTAEPWLLEALPGIGPKLAQAIVDYRKEKGPFRSPGELIRVPGIGSNIYNKIGDLITVGD